MQGLGLAIFLIIYLVGCSNFIDGPENDLGISIETPTRETSDQMLDGIDLSRDQALDFSQDSDLSPSAIQIEDPCVEVNCWEHGRCAQLDSSPSCSCHQNYVAMGLRCILEDQD